MRFYIAAMRIQLLSDIHGNYRALEAVLNECAGYDLLVCLGDYLWTSLGNGPILDWIVKARGEGSILLKGNSDSMDFYHRFGFLSRKDPKEFFIAIQDLPSERRIGVDDCTMLAVHSYRKPKAFSEAFRARNSLLRWMEPAYICKALNCGGIQVLFFGDIHLPYVASTRDLLAINPGSVGYNLDGDPRASFMLIEIRENSVVVEHRRVEYKIEEAVYDVSWAHADPVLGIERGESFRRLIMGGEPHPFDWRTEWGIRKWRPGKAFPSE